MGRIARATGLQFTVTLAQTVIGFAIGVYIIRRLGFGAWGHFAVGMALISWFTIPFTGIRGATLKRMSEGEDRDEFLTAGLAIQSGILALAVLGLFAFRHHVNRYVGVPVASAMVALLVVKLTGEFTLAALRGEDRLELNSLLDGLKGIGLKVAQLGFVLMGAGVIGLYHGITLASAVTLLIGAYLMDTNIQRPTKEHFRSLWDYGRFAWVTNIKNTSYVWLDTLILAFFVSSSAIGAYEAAWGVSALFMLAPRAFGMMVFPTVSNLSANGDTQELETLLNRGLTFSGAFAIPGVIGAALIGREVLSIYGASPSELAIAAPILIVLAVGRVFESYELILMESLNALDYPRRSFKITGVFLAVNLTLNVGLIWTVGAVGAAFATTTSVLMSAALTYRAIPDHIRIRPHTRPVLAQLASAGVMGVTILALTTLHAPESIPVTVAYAFLGAGVYGATLWVTSPFIRAFARDNLPMDALPSFPGVGPERGDDRGTE